MAHIRSLPIALPPLEEQRRIVEQVERRISMIDSASENVIHKSIHAEKLRSGILDSAFAGRLTTQDPADEPASALLKRIRQEGSKAKARGIQRELVYASEGVEVS
ncbi:hypothetical protein H7849_21335 [Alloacidobacterium dinghuense]|uniref:Type I restriction modification DNA specificity domain-containing protein n=1 Tax=Alloacidobacterium dinghuense TaxID=2763107 RepID=A0A7G8BGB5_9BACT|nr:hypothetical protein H7849_21335 [Alloacidobacterium dinghuense]